MEDVENENSPHGVGENVQKDVQEDVQKNVKSRLNNDGGLDMKTLFVRGIPTEVTDGELGEFFSSFAPIKHAVIVKNAEKISRGFGFVSFAVEDDTKEALKQARKTRLNNQLLRVDVAKRRDRTRENADKIAKAKADELPENIASAARFDEESLLKGKPKLIIRNMPWSCRDPQKLKNIFSRYGTVVEATIPRKRDGKLCGFAFVTMKRLANCHNAIEESKDLKIDGRKVAVDFAVQKNKWEDFKTLSKADEDTEKGDEAKEESESRSTSGSDDEESDQSEEEEGAENEDEDSEEEEVHKKANTPLRNTVENYSIFVRNVPYDATESSLADHFSKFGPVKYALPVIDRETGLAKGTAFVAFKNEDACKNCLRNAPAAGATSLLIGDDVLPEYVYEGRVLSISPTLKREDAGNMAERNAAKRKEAFGKSPGERDRRNMYLLNEGKVTEGSKLASLLSVKDMEIRDASFKLRVEQLKKNPSLHLSMTRLAIRNLPRAMTDKGLKALGRKGVVEFATQVKNNERHPLSKEELVRSTKEKYKFMSPEDIERQKKKDRKHGVVTQAKVIMEVKGSSVGRSRGYGFIEYKDHKHSLMGLRWLNVHQVTKSEVMEGLDEKEKRAADSESFTARRLCVEFAIENANVVKRRRERVKQARDTSKRKYEDEPSTTEAEANKRPKLENAGEDQKKKQSDMSDETKRLIGIKRKRKSHKR